MDDIQAQHHSLTYNRSQEHGFQSMSLHRTCTSCLAPHIQGNRDSLVTQPQHRLDSTAPLQRIRTRTQVARIHDTSALLVTQRPPLPLAHQYIHVHPCLGDNQSTCLRPWRTVQVKLPPPRWQPSPRPVGTVLALPTESRRSRNWRLRNIFSIMLKVCNSRNRHRM